MDINLLMPMDTVVPNKVETVKNTQIREDFKEKLDSVLKQKDTTSKDKTKKEEVKNIDELCVGKSATLKEIAALTENDLENLTDEEIEALIMSILGQGLLKVDTINTLSDAKSLIESILNKINLQGVEAITTEESFIEFSRELRSIVGDEAFAKINISEVWETLESVVEDLKIMGLIEGEIQEVIDGVLKEDASKVNQSDYSETEIDSVDINKKSLNEDSLSGQTHHQQYEGQESNTRDSEKWSSVETKLKDPESPFIINHKVPFIDYEKLNMFTSGSRYGKLDVLGTNRDLMLQQQLNIHQQIVDSIQIKNLMEKQELTIQLYPKNLGKVTLKISEENGVILASAQVEQEKVKTALLSNSQELINNLEKQGLKIESFEVEVNAEANKEQEMKKARQKSAKRISDIIKRIESETNELITQVSSEIEVDIKA